MKLPKVMREDSYPLPTAPSADSKPVEPGYVFRAVTNAEPRPDPAEAGAIVDGVMSRMAGAKPLHVRVAEALGCTPRLYEGEWFCDCREDGHRSDGGAGRVASYDTEWADGGELIERFGIATWPDPKIAGLWTAEVRFEQRAQAPTLLEAVCNLILALSAAGKLPK